VKKLVTTGICLAACGLFGAVFIWGRDDSATHESASVTKRERPEEVTEADGSFDIVFTDYLESRFFLHGPSRKVALTTERGTIAFEISRIRHLVFSEGDRRLVVEWDSSTGAHSASFESLDRATWEKLKGFVEAQFGPDLELRESH
jgi:hypothetical protein